MALIKLTDGEAFLYRAWLDFLGESNPQTRTRAFFAARRGERPPLIR